MATRGFEVYRSYLKHLRLLHDPQVWAVNVPKVRGLLDRSRIATTSAQAEVDYRQAKLAQAEKYLKKAQKELNRLRAAVACHPHALKRLLEESYAQRGSTRWDLIRTICQTSSPPQRTNQKLQIPPPLIPLLPLPLRPLEEIKPQRARQVYPDTARRKYEGRVWTRNWAEVGVPVVLPLPPPVNGSSGRSTASQRDTGPKTGWEGTAVVDNLRRLAGVDNTTTEVDLSDLPEWMRRIYPKRKYTLPENPYPCPPPRSIRANPSTWKYPREFTPRLIRRTYKRLWDSLVWVRPACQADRSQAADDKKRKSDRRISEGTEKETADDGPRWVKCSWKKMMSWQGSAPSMRPHSTKWSKASEIETRLYTPAP